MNKVLDRMKGIFRRDPRPQNLPPGSYPNPIGNAETLGTITKPSYPTDDDDNEDTDSGKNYNVPEQTRMRGPPRNSNNSDMMGSNRNPYGTPSPSPMGPPNSQPRTPTVTFRPNAPTISNLRPPFNPNPPPNPPMRPGAPFPPPNNPQRPPFGGFPPSTSPGQSISGPSAPPSSNDFQRSPNPSPIPSNNPPPSSNGFPSDFGSNLPRSNNPALASNGFLPGTGSDQQQAPALNNNTPSPMNRLFGGMNNNQTPPPPPAAPPSTTPNPSSSFPGFTSGGDSRTTFPPSNHQTDNPSKSRPSNSQEENLSRLELDYPIENVLIDANIPSSMAIKINDVVEQDRLGNAYRVHRYTFEPSQPQHLAFNNSQHENNNSFRVGGTRHIREIHQNQQDSSFDRKPHIRRSNRRGSRRRHHYQSQTSLEQYIDQLLRTPGSTVIHAQNSDDLQRILNQHLAYPQMALSQPSVISYPSEVPSYNGLNGPVFYYTARALYDDPMRLY